MDFATFGNIAPGNVEAPPAINAWNRIGIGLNFLPLGIKG